jgi:hypothetical protein
MPRSSLAPSLTGFAILLAGAGCDDNRGKVIAPASPVPRSTALHPMGSRSGPPQAPADKGPEVPADKAKPPSDSPAADPSPKKTPAGAEKPEPPSKTAPEKK